MGRVIREQVGRFEAGLAERNNIELRANLAAQAAAAESSLQRREMEMEQRLARADLELRSRENQLRVAAEGIKSADDVRGLELEGARRVAHAELDAAGVAVQQERQAAALALQAERDARQREGAELRSQVATVLAKLESMTTRERDEAKRSEALFRELADSRSQGAQLAAELSQLRGVVQQGRYFWTAPHPSPTPGRADAPGPIPPVPAPTTLPTATVTVEPQVVRQ